MPAQDTRVLIADDQRSARHGLRALLRTWPGVEVVAEATNGQEAVRLVDEQAPDVVLMDARMPVLDGLEATRIIKGSRKEVKVILLTMQGVSEREARAAGADCLLVKGCRTEDLRDAVLGRP